MRSTKALGTLTRSVPFSSFSPSRSPEIPKTKPEIDDVVEARLVDYAKLLQVSESRIRERYSDFTPRHVMAPIIFVSPSVELSIEKFIGPGVRSIPGRTFGFEFLHSAFNAEHEPETGEPLGVNTRYPLYVIDKKVYLMLTKSAQERLTDVLDVLLRIANHDVLHSVLLDSPAFYVLDRHYRAGGGEVAPVMVQAELVQHKLKSDPAFADSLRSTLNQFISMLREGTESIDAEHKQRGY